MIYGYDSEDSHRSRRGPLRRLWRLITTPFRTVERVERKVVRWFDDRRKKFRHKYRHSKVIAPLVGLIVTILVAPLRLTWFLLTFPFRLLGQLSSPSGSVQRRRAWVHLLQGLPAVFAFVGVAALLIKVTREADDLTDTYRKRAETAFDAGNFERAQLYLQRVLQMGEENDETSFLLARTLERTGHPDRSIAILESLAPDDGRGYSPAHLLKAGELVKSLSTQRSSDETYNLLREHLEAASSGVNMQDNPEFHYYSGKYHLAIMQDAIAQRDFAQLRGDDAAAKQFTEEAIDSESEALGHFKVAAPKYSEQLTKNRQNEVARLRLAEILIEQGEFARMRTILQEGIQLKQKGPFQKALSVGLMRSYEVVPPQSPADRLVLLQLALELDPQNLKAFNALMAFGGVGSDRPAEAQTARDLLEGLISVGESAPLAHFVLGIQAWDRGESDDALWHMERAYRLKPDLVVLGNAFAWMLIHHARNPDPHQALEVINAVLEEHSDIPDYRETRGQILVRLERWEEALDDLEMALPKFQSNADLHTSLATVYRNLGQSSLAEKHERVAAYLRDGRSEDADPR